MPCLGPLCVTSGCRVPQSHMQGLTLSSEKGLETQARHLLHLWSEEGAGVQPLLPGLPLLFRPVLEPG